MNAIVILNYNDFEKTSRLVNRIKNYKSLDHIVIVDNCSTDDSFDRLQRFISGKTVLIRTDYNGGYAKGNNFGLRYIWENFNDVDVILISNPDVLFDEKTLDKLCEAVREHPEYGVIAPIVQNGYNVWKLPGFMGILRSLLLVAFTLEKKKIKRELTFSNEKFHSVGVVEGSLFAVPSKAMKECGGFDERTFLYGEEIILAKRMQMNQYKVGVLTDCDYYHDHSASIKKQFHSSKRKVFHYFKESFSIYNKYYLHTNKVQDLIFILVYGIGYAERAMYDWIYST